MEDVASFTEFQNLVLDKVKEMAEDCKHRREIIQHKQDFLGGGHSND